MDALKAILERRSYRVYQEKPVPNEAVENLLKAGMFAPSAMNSQPWEFLVVRDTEKKSTLADISSNWSMLKHAPLCIIIMANTSGYRSKTTDFFHSGLCCQHYVHSVSRGSSGPWRRLPRALPKAVRDADSTQSF